MIRRKKWEGCVDGFIDRGAECWLLLPALKWNDGPLWTASVGKNDWYDVLYHALKSTYIDIRRLVRVRSDGHMKKILAFERIHFMDIDYLVHWMRTERDFIQAISTGTGSKWANKIKAFMRRKTNVTKCAHILDQHCSYYSYVVLLSWRCHSLLSPPFTWDETMAPIYIALKPD